MPWSKKRKLQERTQRKIKRNKPSPQYHMAVNSLVTTGWVVVEHQVHNATYKQRGSVFSRASEHELEHCFVAWDGNIHPLVQGVCGPFSPAEVVTTPEFAESLGQKTGITGAPS
jgi:hypothetical protein